MQIWFWHINTLTDATTLLVPLTWKWKRNLAWENGYKTNIKKCFFVPHMVVTCKSCSSNNRFLVTRNLQEETLLTLAWTKISLTKVVGMGIIKNIRSKLFGRTSSVIVLCNNVDNKSLISILYGFVSKDNNAMIIDIYISKLTTKRDYVYIV